jgi:gamma-glutamyl-gamma-aminobutyrate hydrolase PuuD/NAD(P)-dependent dehydrogenase (short-subunit alcohol dehydrogenase family)
MYQQVVDAYGAVHVAFNNAGISPPDDDSILSTGIDAWRRVQEVNLTSVFLCCKHVIPHMQRQVAAGGRGGSIINTASFVATLGAATSQISYTASKGGVLAMTRELGVQFAREGIRVNALSPGPVNTPLLRELFAKDPQRAARRLVHVPMGRFAEADEIAAAVAFLARDDASFITSSNFLMEGGISGATDAARAPERAPLIATSTHGPPARSGRGDPPAALVPMSQPEAVAAAEGVPVLLPPLPGIEEALSRLDALVLPGGGDIDPAAYGADPHPLTERVYPGRDQAERALLAAALAAGIPVLAICRGLQIVNVSRGGTLRQHLPDEVGHHNHGPVAGTYGSHPVRIAADSLRGRILGPPGADGQVRAAVPTYHHQAIERLGRGLVATAWADDGTIEAVEPDPASNGETGFLLAVQWHPEAGDDLRLFEALITKAGAGKAGAAQPLDSRA